MWHQITNYQEKKRETGETTMHRELAHVIWYTYEILLLLDEMGYSVMIQYCHAIGITPRHCASSNAAFRAEIREE